LHSFKIYMIHLTPTKRFQEPLKTARSKFRFEIERSEPRKFFEIMG